MFLIADNCSAVVKWGSTIVKVSAHLWAGFGLGNKDAAERRGSFARLAVETLEDGVPVGAYFLLGFRQRHVAGTYLFVQVVFKLVLLVESGRGRRRFRPKVSDVVRAAKFRRDEVKWSSS